MNNFDSPWKESLDLHFPQFLQFFFPDIHQEVDWSCGYQLLDKELREVLREEELGNREVDCLVRLTLKNGQEQWVLIHVEVQSQYDPDFPMRMLIYHARILSRYGRRCCSLAILGDDRPDWRPHRGASELWGCRLALEFPVRKLLDYPTRVEQPENPFAWLVAAHLQAIATRQDPIARKSIKLTLVMGLHRAGLNRAQILGFMRLVDWVLALPKELEYAFREELQQLEEENHVAYKTSIERLSWEEGKAEGELSALRRVLSEAAFTRWGIDVRSRVEAITDLSLLESLMRGLLTAGSEQEWQQSL